MNNCVESYSNAILLENFISMQKDQVGRDKFGYVDIAMEAVSNTQVQPEILNKLYKDIQKIEEIDFGKIPDSKGDLTRYVYYEQMSDCINILNDLLKSNPTDNLNAMNKLHQILLHAVDDYRFGFKVNNFIIISTYNLMVTNLYEMINVCIVDATEYLRAKLKMNVDKSTKKKMRFVTNNVLMYIKMYESGQWNTLMKAFRSKAVASAYENITTDAMEAGTISEIVDLAKNAKGGISGLFSQAKNIFTNSPMFMKVIGILITLLFILRGAVKYFFSGAGKISDKIKEQVKLVKAVQQADDRDTSSTKYESKVLDMMENVSDTIDYKIFKTEKKTETELAQSNRDNFSPSDLKPVAIDDISLI